MPPGSSIRGIRIPRISARHCALLLGAVIVAVTVQQYARQGYNNYLIFASSLKVLLAHQPRSAAAASAAGFDLQLSGHTHGGQFLPWSFFVRFQQPFTAGLHRAGAMLVYVSRGTGYWGPPKRVGAPSEITRIRLTASP